MTNATELAEAHWDYVCATLEVHGIADVQLGIIKHHYISAMIHGYKHGREDAGKEIVTCKPGDFVEVIKA